MQIISVFGKEYWWWNECRAKTVMNKLIGPIQMVAGMECNIGSHRGTENEMKVIKKECGPYNTSP